MLNYGPKKDMEKRPEHEPKFSMKNKTDRTIVTTAVVLVAVALLLIAALLLAWYWPVLFPKS